MPIDAHKLQKKMEECSMTQSKLAKLVGISKSTMSRKVSGESDFSVGQAFKMCLALNIEDPKSIFLP